ncbi:MAG: phosphatidate cytidylyltransferase [Acidobacteria bacterium]|nr:phosphatidate cytidylyltransferase [Acidobacteriota bacterium]
MSSTAKSEQDQQPAPRERARFTREITSFVAGPVLVLIVGWAPGLVVAAVITLVAAIALWEFLSMGEKKGLPIQKVLSMILLLILLTSFLLPAFPVEAAILAVLMLIPMAYVFSRSDLSAALPASAVCVLGILYVGLLSGAMMGLRLHFEPHGSDLLFFLLLVVWAGDALAYYTGRKFGKTRLLPRVSPKKTVEGLLGGVAGSLITAAVIQLTFFGEFPLVHALICAALVSLSGVVGDLAESAWKRSAEIKDSGTIIPGHGGILDRTDSILFAAPVLYAYWYLLHGPFRLP